jgi:ribose transport system substrate-binding protein
MKNKIILLLCLILAGTGLVFAQSTEKKVNAKNITIGLIGKSQSNPVFMAAYSGARVAAKEIGAKYGVQVTIDWQTPQNENPKEQAQAIEKLSHSGAAGIAIACSDASIVTPAIDKAVDLGTQVVCFDSDAPKSKRVAYYGTDDIEFGHMALKELAQAMNEKGVVAMIAGNKNAPNLQRRVHAVMEELKNYPSMKLLPNGVFYHEEIAEKAADVVARAQKANPQIEGWIFVGGWPLWAKDAIQWNPGKVKIVACDALPKQLDYVKSGHVQVLIAQGCFLWGYTSVELLVNKVLKNQNPSEEFIAAPMTRVTKENLDEWSLNWKKWLLKEAVNR